MSSSRQLQVEDARASGLTSVEAAERLRRYRPNRVPEASPASRLELFVRQLANPMVVLLRRHGLAGYGPVRSALLGAVSSAVMRTAPRPVLIAPRGLEHTGRPADRAERELATD